MGWWQENGAAIRVGSDKLRKEAIHERAQVVLLIVAGIVLVAMKLFFLAVGG